eukprot:scaffold274439_cov21-Tisochrysis_lutea.AAC.1
MRPLLAPLAASCPEARSVRPRPRRSGVSSAPKSSDRWPRLPSTVSSFMSLSPCSSSPVEDVAEHELRGTVEGRADVECVRAPRDPRARLAKVGDLGPQAIVDEHVRRLEVAVEHPLRVEVLEATGDVKHHQQALLVFEQVIGGAELVEAALKGLELGHQTAVLHLVHVQQLEHVGVRQAPQSTQLLHSIAGDPPRDQALLVDLEDAVVAGAVHIRERASADPPRVLL